MGKVIGKWRRRHIEKLHDMSSLLNITWMIKSRNEGHIAHIGREEVHAKFWW
jgi:hypothetical protein